MKTAVGTVFTVSEAFSYCVGLFVLLFVSMWHARYILCSQSDHFTLGDLMVKVDGLCWVLRSDRAVHRNPHVWKQCLFFCSRQNILNICLKVSWKLKLTPSFSVWVKNNSFTHSSAAVSVTTMQSLLDVFILYKITKCPIIHKSSIPKHWWKYLQDVLWGCSRDALLFCTIILIITSTSEVTAGQSTPSKKACMHRRERSAVTARLLHV